MKSKPQEEKKQSSIAWYDMPGRKSLKDALKQHLIDESKLSFRQNLLDSNDIKLLLQFLKTNPNITSLDLCWNKIGHEGAKALAENFTLVYIIDFKQVLRQTI